MATSADDGGDAPIPLLDPLDAFPADLAAVIVWTVATTLSVFVPVVNETPLRVVLGLPYVLFVPGYVFIAALFPEAGESPGDVSKNMPDGEKSDDGGSRLLGDGSADDDESRLLGGRDRAGIDGIERVALSLGLSIAVVPLIGLVLNFTPFGIRLAPIVVSLDLFILGFVVAAVYRRQQLPIEERFRVPYDDWIASGQDELFEPDSRADAALNVLLAVSVVLAVASVGYAVAVPKPGEKFSEFYLLTYNETGNLTADGYPTEFTVGESKPVVVGIANQEHEPVEYTVVVVLQDVRFGDNGTNVSVLRESELMRYEHTLRNEERYHRNVSISPSFEGKRLRVAFLLFRDEVPADPTIENAYRETHLWVEVSS